MSKSTNYWNDYGNSRLHTNYNYFRPNSFYSPSTKFASIEALRIEGAMKQLQAKELSFYRLFGCNSFEEFIALLRQLQNSPDGNILKRFSSESILQNVIRKLEREKSKNLLTGTIKVIPKIDAANKALADVVKKIKSIKIQNNSFIGQINGDFSLMINLDVPSLKALINTLFPEQRFHLTSFNSERISKFLRDNEAQIAALIKIEDGYGRQLSTEEIAQTFKYRPYPWGYTNKELRENKNDPIMLQQLKHAINDIHNEIYNMTSDSSPELKAAVKETLVNNVDIDYNIFFVGANYEAGLKGAFGEFGTAVLFNYLRRKYGIYNTTIQEEIIGSKLLGKTDVNILGAFGVQVKNYATFDNGEIAHTFKDIESRQQPQEFVKYLEHSAGGSAIGESFLGFLANYFFNSTIKQKQAGTFDDLKNFISHNLIAEVFRLATNDIPDTLTFYHVNMGYFIPGSMILSFYLQLGDVQVDIKGPAPTYNDPIPSRGPNDFWSYRSGNFWVPTEKNNLDYVLNHVSIIAVMSGFSMAQYRY